MQHPYMRRFGLFLICLLAFVTFTASAGSYSLADGSQVEGDPISITDYGVVFHTADGRDLPRISLDKFTQDSLRTLRAGARSAREQALLDPWIEELPQDKAERKEIIVKPIQPPDRPTTRLGLMALFSSPVGLTIFLILYGANLFAASEVAIYRRQSLSTVCGLAAIPFFGVLSPLIFVAMPTKVAANEVQDEPQTRFRATPPPTSATAPAPVEETGAVETQPSLIPDAIVAAQPEDGPLQQEATPGLPEPIIFRRGDFSFNRRFFETKLAGFFRVVPIEAEKDMVIHIKSGRGDFTGRRITRITPAELYLQVYHDNATADEMIPFIEILEVQMRHKDTV
jgi:hypothetical protein